MSSVNISRAALRASTRKHPHIGVLLQRARRYIDEEVARRLNAAGFANLRTGHSSVFSFLTLDGTTLTELAARARMTKQAMGELVRELEELGYVERVVDPEDRRAKIIRFTDAGQRADEIGVLTIRDIEREWAAGIGVERVRDLRSALTTLLRSIDRDAASPSAK